MPMQTPQTPASAPAELTLGQQTRMVQALRERLAAEVGANVRWIETHISIVLVAGAFAYKFKKALHTPFLDQSTLALRRHACAEELRLNRRLAPTLYLAAVPIAGTPDEPVLGGAGAPIDVAVQMRAFAARDLWDRLASRGELRARHIDELVQLLGDFHAAAAVADPAGGVGAPQAVRAALLESLDELDAAADGGAQRDTLGTLRRWEATAFGRLEPLMRQRLAAGRVRECHGDLHLGNVAQFEGRTTVFDGIEFNDDFRWIDVMSEIAFMAMDLQAHGLHRLAHRFVDGCLSRSGDFEGVALLDWYLVHRALVRAKVAALLAQQCAEGAGIKVTIADGQRRVMQQHLDLALHFSRRSAAGPALMVTHGLSGSGKSTLTQGLLEAAGAIRIRADVERKRLAGLAPLARVDARRSAELYSAAANEATQARLLELAAPVLASGRSVILDATFLRRGARDAARAFAARAGVPFLILDFDADPAVLRQRLRERSARADDASDADEAVLDLQLRYAEPLQPDEAADVARCGVVTTDAEGQFEADWSAVLARLAPSAGAAGRQDRSPA